MSWIDKELKRRAKAVQAEAVVRESEAERRDPSRLMVELWQRFEAANAALPTELRLRVERVDTPPTQGPRFQTWLRADNGAGLGFAGDAIRYVWPERNAKKSRNFWIRWNPDRDRPEVMRRVGSATPPLTVSIAQTKPPSTLFSATCCALADAPHASSSYWLLSLK